MTARTDGQFKAMDNNQEQNQAPAQMPEVYKGPFDLLAKQCNLSNINEVQGILLNTVMPTKGATYEQMAAFAMVAAQYGLNPFTREIYAFPQNGGIVPIVGIDGWLKLMHRNPDFNGIEHVWAEDGSWCECRIYSKKFDRPVVAREFLSENQGGTDPWKKRPMRMLKHRATIQAIRYFGGYAGIADRDEMQEFGEMRDVTPKGDAVKPALFGGGEPDAAPAVEVQAVPAAAVPVQGAQVFEQRGFDMFGEEVQA